MEIKRSITVNLSESASNELERVKASLGRLTDEELFYNALNMMKIYADAKAKGQRVVVDEHNGKVRVINLVIPPPVAPTLPG